MIFFIIFIFFRGESDSWEVLGGFSFIITSVCLIRSCTHTRAAEGEAVNASNSWIPVCDKAGGIVFFFKHLFMYIPTLLFPARASQE